jgi:hypothetical protein
VTGRRYGAGYAIVAAWLVICLALVIVAAVTR